MQKRNFKKYGAVIFSLGILAVVSLLYFLQTPSKSLDQEEFSKLHTELISITHTQSPREALEKIEVLAASDERVLHGCHPLVHEIGHTAFAKYEDVATALAYSDEFCGSGYLHGVIESYINKNGYSKEALVSLCDRYTNAPDRDNCYHGVGHGLMYYSGNDVTGSVATCDKFPVQKARLRCSEGVFMENFASDEANHPSEYLNRDDIFSLCRAQSKPYQKDTCYFYAPLYYLNIHPGAYIEAFDWCAGAEEGFLKTCIKGTASRVTKDNSERIAYVAHLCFGLPANEQNACAAGIGSYHFTQFADIEKTRTVCNSLYAPLRKSCLATVASQ